MIYLYYFLNKFIRLLLRRNLMKVFKYILALFFLFLIFACQSGNWETLGKKGISHGLAWYNSLVIDNGTPYVAFKDKYAGPGCKPNPAAQHCGLGEITVLKWNKNMWESIGKPRFSGPASYLSLEAHNGNLYVAFYDLQQNGKASVMQYKGNSWEYVGKRGFSNGPAHFTTVKIFKGSPYISYTDESLGFKAVVQKWNGQEWEAVGSPGFTSGPAYYLSLDFSKSAPYVAFKDESAGGKASAMVFQGNQWVNVGKTGFSKGIVEFVSLSMQGDVPHIAFLDASRENRATVMKFTGENWITAGKPGFTEGKAHQISLKADSKNLYMAFKDIRDGEELEGITVMKFENEQWATLGKSRFSASHVLHPSLFISGNTAYVAFADASVSQKLTVMKYHLK
jgi:hypothetical protein